MGVLKRIIQVSFSGEKEIYYPWMAGTFARNISLERRGRAEDKSRWKEINSQINQCIMHGIK